MIYEIMTANLSVEKAKCLQLVKTLGDHSRLPPRRKMFPDRRFARAFYTTGLNKTSLSLAVNPGRLRILTKKIVKTSNGSFGAN